MDRGDLGVSDPGVALAAVGSLARGDAGPLSDYDLVLVHQARSIARAELGALAEKLWYPLWDSGAARPLGAHRRPVPRGRGRRPVGGGRPARPRHVAGDAEVVSAARSTVAHDWRGNARRRLPQILEVVRSGTPGWATSLTSSSPTSRRPAAGCAT